jgi:xanthine dehydrogenase accessory factor
VGVDALARVRAPAGLDLGKVEPGEIGVAVLAELVALKGAGGLRASMPPAPAYEEARDPVCGMTVDVARTRHGSEYDGRDYFFCSAGCLRAFEADPLKYAVG